MKRQKSSKYIKLQLKRKKKLDYLKKLALSFPVFKEKLEILM